MAVEISTVEELQAISSGPSGDYVLVNDIDASETVGWNGGAGFLPIVNFSGSLDGAGFTIDGLFINYSTHGSGLFGRTGTSNFSGLLKNIRFTNLHIEHEGPFQYAGLVSDSSGIIENVGVDSGLIYVGSGWYCGLVGRAREGSVVQDCYNLGLVASSSSDARIAGLIGRMESGSLLIRSYAAGLVNAANGGGAVGTSSGMVTGCFWDTQTTGKATSAGGTGKTTAEMKTLSTFTGAGWDIVSGVDDSKVWGIDPGINTGYPFLQVFQRKQRGLVFNPFISPVFHSPRFGGIT